jgi:lipopolysaccharide heptosyltransferase III
MNKQLNLASVPKRILVISMRHLGDVLLATPLISTLRKGFPNAQLDFLVYSNTAGMLEGNPDISNVLTTPQRSSWSDSKALIKKIYRSYDLTIITETGDRRYLYAILSAPLRIAFAPPKNEPGWWKRYFAQAWTEFDETNTHTVLELLKLTELIHLHPQFDLVMPKQLSHHKTPLDNFLKDTPEYVVLHMHPLRNYKRWTVSGWIEIGRYLHTLGYQLVLTGGPATEELNYIASIQQQLPADTNNIAGQTTLAQLAYIITRAKLYIGPDTGTTHLAAATGTPVISLYGPTNPVKWAPWPFAYRKKTNPFKSIGSQHINNVYLLQGEADCVPCDLEGCERHRQSYSRCLDTLAPERVKQAIREVMESSQMNSN